MHFSRKSRKHLKISSAVLALSTGWSSVALAQDVATGEGVNEIIVTATKSGSSTIQEVPLSVQALGGAKLEENGALDFKDYYRQIAGLSVNDQGPGNKQYNIRGVNSSGAGTVALYFDEAILTDENTSGDGGRSPDVKLFDMERVEVLRGPQGSTFGSSSLSGVIRWLPNFPDVGSVSAGFGAELEQPRESSDIGWRADGFVNLPVISDKLAIRVSGALVRGAGYIDNRYERDANAERTEAVRAMVLLKPVDELEVSAFYMKQNMTVGARSFYNAMNFYLEQSPSMRGGPLPTTYYQADQARGGFTDNMDIYSGKITWGPDWGSFTATSSYVDRYTQDRRPTSAAGEILTGGALAADSTGRSRLETTKNRTVWNSELRFASSWDSTFQVLVGGFYQRTKSLLQTEFITLGEDGRVGPESRSLLNNTVRDKKTERAAFGELRWEGIEGLTVTGGARVFKFKIDAQGNVITAPFERPGAGFGVPYGTSQSDAIFKGNISYQFNPDVMAYVQVSEGYRPGGANDQAVTLLTGVPIPLGFNSDSIVNYELGFKTSLLDRAVTFNGALYVIDWSDIQVRRKAVNTATGVQYDFRGNGGTAKVKGIELKTQVRPIAGLEFGGSLAYTDAKLTEDLPVLDDGLKGDRIPYVPKWTLSANARYEMQLSEGVSGFVGGDWSYTGSSGNRLRPTDRYYRVNQSYGITNLRVGVELESDWDIVLSLKNVFDSKRTIFYAFDFQGPPPPGGFVPDNLVRPWPRTLALSVRKSIF